MSPEALRNIEFDLSIKARYGLSDEQFEDYVERVGICVESGVSEELAVKIAIEQVKGVLK